MKQRNIRIGLIAGVSALAMALGGASSASAAALATTTIGTKTSSTLTNTFASTPALPDNSKITVTANFTNHTANSVKITTYRICYTSGPAASITIAPYTRNSGGNTAGDTTPWLVVAKGKCQTWTANKVYNKQSDNEVVRVVSRIGTTIETIAAWYR